MFFWQNQKPEKPTEAQVTAQAFDDFSRALTPEMINQIRTERTRSDAQQEGFQTARLDMADRVESDVRSVLHLLADNLLPQKHGLIASSSTEYREWLHTTAHELSQQLARMHQRVIHQPESGGSLSVQKRVQLEIESSPELQARFEHLCRRYYFCGGVMHASGPSVQEEMHSVIAVAIENRPVGASQPLTYREFREVLERNKAIALLDG